MAVGRKSLIAFGTLGFLAAWVCILLSVTTPNDFISYYTAAQLLRFHPHELYSVSAQIAAQKAVGNRFYLSWAHLPAEALLFVPLSFLSYPHAFALWAALNLAMIALCIYLLRDEILALKPGGHYALLAFAFLPAAEGLVMGQDHILFLLLWVLAWRCLKNKNDFGVGVLIGLSLIRYQFTLPMLLFIIVLRKWKLLAGFVAAAGALLAVSFVLCGPGFATAYIGLLRYQAHVDNANWLSVMPTLRGVAGLISPAHNLAIAGAATVILLGWAFLTIRKMAGPQAFSFAMVVSMLADPHAFSYELIVLVIPLALFLRKHPRAAVVGWLLTAMAMLSFMLHQRIFALYGIVLLIWAFWMARDHLRQSEPAAMPTAETAV